MRPKIQQTVDSLIDGMLKEGGKKPLDIVEKLALPVASYVSSLSVWELDKAIIY